MEIAWYFYWLIAAVVCFPIVLIVKGVMADKGKRKMDQGQSGTAQDSDTL